LRAFGCPVFVDGREIHNPFYNRCALNHKVIVLLLNPLLKIVIPKFFTYDECRQNIICIPSRIMPLSFLNDGFKSERVLISARLVQALERANNTIQISPHNSADIIVELLDPPEGGHVMASDYPQNLGRHHIVE